MKNKFSRAILLAAFCSLLLSQHGTAQSIGSAGIKGGLSVSTLYPENANNQSSRLGFNAGLYGQILSSEAFAVQLELLYSTKGSTAQSVGAIDQQVTYHLNYLDLPVLAVFKLADFAEIQLGGYASYLLNANISYKGDFATGSSPINKDNLKSFDYGIAGGIGAHFGKVKVGARYNFGVVKIANSNTARTYMGDAKNTCAQLFVAYDLRSR